VSSFVSNSKAEENKIEVAYSNDSFELWYLLHLQEVQNPMDRSVIEEKLKSHLTNYYHGKGIFDEIDKHYGQAVKRAKKLLENVDNNHIKPVDANPSTRIHILTEKLRGNKA